MLPSTGGVTVDRVLCFINAAIDAGRTPYWKPIRFTLRVILELIFHDRPRILHTDILCI